MYLLVKWVIKTENGGGFLVIILFVDINLQLLMQFMKCSQICMCIQCFGMNVHFYFITTSLRS